MLKHISPLLSPILLKTLCEMGHGDEIVIADGGFPAERLGKDHIVIRADGLGTAPLLDAILALFPLDQYDDENCIVMEVVKGDSVTPTIWDDYRAILAKHEPKAHLTALERQAYYDRAQNAYAIIATGETAQYANILLKKGVVQRG